MPEIALCYKEIAQRLNHEVAESVMETYVSMIRERDRLHHRISLLAPRQAEIIQEYYIRRNSWGDIAKNMGLSLRTAYSTRQQAVDVLVQMYTFTGAVFDGPEE